MSMVRPAPFSKTLALVPPVVALAAQSADASLFIKIEPMLGAPLTGEVTEKGHEGWIDASSAGFSVSNPVTMSSQGLQPGQAVASAIELTKLLDKTSPALFLACAQGTSHAKITFEFTMPNSSGVPTCYYRITLANVIVSKLSNSAESDRPSESVSLTYEKITTEYYMQDAKGTFPSTPTATSTWNFVTNSPK